VVSGFPQLFKQCFGFVGFEGVVFVVIKVRLFVVVLAQVCVDSRVLRFQNCLTLVEEAFIRFLRKITGSSRQGIWLSAGLARSIGYDTVESEEEFGPAGLSSIKALGGHEVFQVTVIRENLVGVWGRLELGAPFFETSYNRHEFLVGNPIIALCRCMLLRIKGHRVKDSLVIVLREYSGRNIVGGIGFHNDFFVGVEV
jgi:hypothetical protein